MTKQSTQGGDNTTQRSSAISPEVVQRCREGDHAALRLVFETYSGSLTATLRMLVGPRADLDDLLQDTFLSAAQSFPRFRGEASVRTWLRRIAVRRAIDFLRKPASRRTEPLLTVASDAPNIADRAVARERLARVYEHLERIKPKKRTAFILHVFEGRSMEEVAALTGATRAATKSRVLFARRELLRRAQSDPILREYLQERVEHGQEKP